MHTKVFTFASLIIAGFIFQASNAEKTEEGFKDVCQDLIKQLKEMDRTTIKATIGKLSNRYYIFENRSQDFIKSLERKLKPNVDVHKLKEVLDEKIQKIKQANKKVPKCLEEITQISDVLLDEALIRLKGFVAKEMLSTWEYVSIPSNQTLMYTKNGMKMKLNKLDELRNKCKDKITCLKCASVAYNYLDQTRGTLERVYKSVDHECGIVENYKFNDSLKKEEQYLNSYVQDMIQTINSCASE